MQRPPGQIILLNGPSSAGKSIIARALQEIADIPFWCVSFDTLRDNGALPMARCAQGDFDWQDLRDAVFDGFHASLAAYAQAGNHLIVEHVIDTAHWHADLRRLLAPFDVFFVGVVCAAETLERREALRGNRAPGSALADREVVHTGCHYDLKIDGDTDPRANARKILESWRSGTRASGFT